MLGIPRRSYHKCMESLLRKCLDSTWNLLQALPANWFLASLQAVPTKALRLSEIVVLLADSTCRSRTGLLTLHGLSNGSQSWNHTELLSTWDPLDMKGRAECLFSMDPCTRVYKTVVCLWTSIALTILLSLIHRSTQPRYQKWTWLYWRAATASNWAIPGSQTCTWKLLGMMKVFWKLQAARPWAAGRINGGLRQHAAVTRQSACQSLCPLRVGACQRWCNKHFGTACLWRLPVPLTLSLRVWTANCRACCTHGCQTPPSYLTALHQSFFQTIAANSMQRKSTRQWTAKWYCPNGHLVDCKPQPGMPFWWRRV